MGSAADGQSRSDAARSLVAEVSELARRVAVLAAEAGFAGDADLLVCEQNRHKGDTVAIAVVGASKGGKSSLVNALLRRPGLAPVSPSLATVAPVLFSYGDSDTATVSRGARPEQVGLETVGRYILEGAASEGVTSVTLTLDAPLLHAGLSLLDTPSISGLSGQYSDGALSSIAPADALLFVSDASTPLTLPEITFLKSASSRVETVLLALTKVDLHPHWRVIGAENQALITTHAPELSACPVYPIASPLIFRRDAEMSDQDVDRLRCASGIPVLADALINDVANRGTEVRALNLCRMVTAVVDRIQQLEQVRLRAAEQDPTLEAQLQSTLKELGLLTSGQGRWRATLDDEFAILRGDVDARLELGARNIGDVIADLINGSKPDPAESAVEHQLRVAVEALWLECIDEVDSRSELVYAEICRSLVGVTGGVELPPVSGRVWSFEYHPRPARSQADSGYDQMGKLLKFIGAFASLGQYNPLPLGAAVVDVLTSKRREEDRARTASKQSATEAVHRVLQDARTNMGNQLATALIGRRRRVADEIDARLAARGEELEQLREQRSQMAKAEAESSAEAQSVASSRLNRLAEVRDLVARVHSLAAGGLIATG